MNFIIKNVRCLYLNYTNLKPQGTVWAQRQVNCHAVPYRTVFLRNIIFNMRCKFQIAKSKKTLFQNQMFAWTVKYSDGLSEFFMILRNFYNSVFDNIIILCKMKIKDFLLQSFYVNFNRIMKVIGCQWVCFLSQICWIYEAKKFRIRPTIHQKP